MRKNQLTAKRELLRPLAGMVLAAILMLSGLPAHSTTPSQAVPKPQSAPRWQRWSAEGFIQYQLNNYQGAALNFKRAANAGDVSSAYNLALMRFSNETKLITQAQALGYLKKSAEGGFSLAQHMLGVFLETGRLVPKSQALATHWFEKAAQGGLEQAFEAVATQYYLGRGVPRDYVKAARWYEKSAEKGDVGSQYLIASMYETGTGVTLNLQTALEWYSAAARQGDLAAKEKAKSITEQLATEKPA